MIKCPVCVTENSDDTIFCKSCGVKMALAFEAARRVEREKNKNVNYTVQCPKCYEINSIDSHFCKWCGLDLSKEKILRKFSNGTEAFSDQPISTSKTSPSDEIAIKIAAILIFIDAGVFTLITLASIWYTIAYQANFDVVLNSWNVIMTIFSVFVGIEVLKKTSSGYSRALYMNGIGVIWYGYQAIASSWTLGYFLAILCGVSFFLIKANSRLFAKAQKTKK